MNYESCDPSLTFFIQLMLSHVQNIFNSSLLSELLLHKKLLNMYAMIVDERDNGLAVGSRAKII